jgi:gas vesicle protein
MGLQRSDHMVAKNTPSTLSPGKLMRQASEVGEQFKDEARSIGQQISEKASEAAGALKDEVERVVDEQKGRAAKRIARWGSAAQKAARVLHAGGIDNVAGYAETAADSVENAARYIEETDLGTMARDLSDAAKQHPSIFFGAMFVAGLAAARVIKVVQDSGGDEDEES